MEANIALPAALIGDPARAAILSALCDGRAQPAGALAYAARVTPQSASNHLAKLLEGGACLPSNLKAAIATIGWRRLM
jgi:DNA-binding transcriptional ArsR family regulator